MSDVLSVKQKTWYLRLKGSRQGPYPAAKIRNMLLQESLGLEDEISADGKSWQKLRHVPEVIPLQLRAELGDTEAQELLHGRERMQQTSRGGNSRRFPLLALSIVLCLILGVVGISLWKGMPLGMDDPDCLA